VVSAPVAATPVRLPVAQAGMDPQSAGNAVRDQARTWSAAEKLDYLRRKNLGNCQRCKLAGSRTNIVYGVGNPEAALMFIGEAPGFDEDREGVPFVGAAGRRLTQWLGRLGLTRDQVYIANVLKCRPPNNRDPEPDEVERCSPFLRAQIRAIAPRVLVALGRHAGMLLLGGGHERTLRDMRGRSWSYRDPGGAHEALLYVTYHPSYVIRRERELPPGQRNPADDTVISDLQQALQKLRSS
jgi:DNA polymerase